MPVDTNELREIAVEMVGGDRGDVLIKAATEIEMLRRHLAEAHASNDDSERLNWLAQQAHEEYCEPAHRSYFLLPRVLKAKHGHVAHNLREAIDMVRKPHRADHT